MTRRQHYCWRHIWQRSALFIPWAHHTDQNRLSLRQFLTPEFPNVLIISFQTRRKSSTPSRPCLTKGLLFDFKGSWPEILLSSYTRQKQLRMYAKKMCQDSSNSPAPAIPSLPRISWSQSMFFYETKSNFILTGAMEASQGMTLFQTFIRAQLLPREIRRGKSRIYRSTSSLFPLPKRLVQRHFVSCNANMSERTFRSSPSKWKWWESKFTEQQNSNYPIQLQVYSCIHTSNSPQRKQLHINQ